MRTLVIGRCLFALGSASLAILSLIYRDLAPLGPSLPAPTPWEDIGVYGPSILVLAASAGLCFSRTAPLSALAIGLYQGLWAASGIPSIISKPFSVGAWYGCCEALTSLAGASILYVVLRSRSLPPEMSIASRRCVRAAQILFGLTCVFYGWSHFAYADYTAGMVPGWAPDRLGFAYFTGMAHIAAGIGIVLAILPRLAATLEALMMSLFGLLVWVPSFFQQPRPAWATPSENQWSELVVTVLLAASAWIVAISLGNRPWMSARR